MLRENSRTFFAASLLLPRSAREPASALYAFCRLADDAVDVNGGRLDAVENLRERLARAYAGEPMDVAADRAFAATVSRHAIPRALPDALLEGFEWDVLNRRYDDIEGLFDYSARVAGTVGAMMAVVMGARSADALARACDLGVAMQLSNIARDVGEDARAGRLYLPLTWMREAGIDPDAWLAAPKFNSALGSVVERLLKTADVLYDRVGSGVGQLPLVCQPGINAARFLYAEIGREVARAGFDSVSRRAVVPAARKARLLTRALVASVPGERGKPAPPLEQCRFLVEAVTEMQGAKTPGDSVAAEPAWWNLNDRVVWLIDLFERLERRERGEQVARNGLRS
jgi:phytoene synthase